jgi:hypothetical protein
MKHGDLPHAIRDCSAKAEHLKERMILEFTKDGATHALDEFLSTYTRILSDKPAYKTYGSIKTQTADLCEKIRLSFSECFLDKFHRVLLLHLIERFDGIIKSLTLPRSILDLYPIQFERMMHEITTGSVGPYNYKNDNFTKDICICSHRLVPTGARVVEPEAGLPRRVLVKQGAFGCLTMLSRVLLELKGFRPLCSVHVHKCILEEFNSEGHERTFHRWSDLLKVNPHIKGIMGSSWFYDPKVMTISPHLSCVRDIPERNGAFFLAGGPDEASTNAALSNSVTRRRLFERGEFEPKLYYMLWPRQHLIKWADSH